MAEEVGVTRKTINTVERGHYVPSTVLALRLAGALGASVEELFEARMPKGKAEISHIDGVVEIADRVRAVTDAPIVFGVGISNPEQAAAAGKVADGVIVGSALVRRALEADTAEDARQSLSKAVADIAAALKP